MEAAGPQQMYVHYQQVGEIHAAVIVGDVGAVRAPARALANARSTHGAASDASWDLMQGEARVIQGQSEIDDIARSVARMGMACGDCHTAVGDGPEMNPGEAPPSSQNPGAHMIRHQWGLDRMWEGLVGPSEASWAAGAGALGDEAMQLGSGDWSDDVERLTDLVHELGGEARHTADWHDRADIYAKLLASCSACHQDLNVRMR